MAGHHGHQRGLNCNCLAAGLAGRGDLARGLNCTGLSAGLAGCGRGDLAGHHGHQRGLDCNGLSAGFAGRGDLAGEVVEPFLLSRRDLADIVMRYHMHGTVGVGTV